ncbi:MAG: REP-associated tyrosine transposase [Nitrospirales bacterium]
MPRTARASVGGLCYHVINRGNARADVFRKSEDYAAFRELVREAADRVRMRVLAYCLMPNHFHLTLWPRGEGDLSRFMQWLLTAHVRRYHRHYQSSGHVWQGRFKAFPIQQDEHLLTVLRYIERNPLRAGLVARAEDWLWSSLWERGAKETWLQPAPVAGPKNWVGWVNGPMTDAEVEVLRLSVNRGRPFGAEAWVQRTARRLGLETSLNPRGRPRTQAKK